MIPWKIILLVLFCTLLGTTGQIFMKLGSSTFTFNLWAMMTNWRLIIGAVCYGLSAILFVYALKFIPLSYGYPLIAMTYIWVPIASIVFLHETFAAWKWAGIVSILLGVIICAI